MSATTVRLNPPDEPSELASPLAARCGATGGALLEGAATSGRQR